MGVFYENLCLDQNGSFHGDFGLSVVVLSIYDDDDDDDDDDDSSGAWWPFLV